MSGAAQITQWPLTLNEPNDQDQPRTQRWIVVGWDGFLPLFVAMVPLVVRGLFPKGHITEVIAAAFLPSIAALVRAAAGSSQIRQACHGQLPVLRQLVLAIAIIVLIVFESCAAVMTFDEDAREDLLLVVGICYVVYLALIALALRPVQKSS
jgi:hypothetical protein